MSRRPRYLLQLFAIMFLAVVLPRAAATYAAQPGEQITNATGSLTATSTTGDTFVTPVYTPGPTNIRLEVSGGAATDRITMTLQGATPQTWDVRSGETTWAYATIPAGGKLMLQNKSAAALSYKLVAYARGTVTSIAEGETNWSGTTRGAGIQSSIQLDVPIAGRYSFTLGAGSGGFQLKVDGDANYLRKTVVPEKAPAPADSVYYLSAGTHTFTIEQHASATLTTWSLGFSPVAGNETIPSSESSAVLGGGSFFNEEWIPLQMTGAQAVNMRIQASGGAGDSLVVELYNDANKVFTSARVFGGEVVWGSSNLTTGANRLRIVASGNAAALAYTIALEAVPQTPLAWTGTAYGKSEGNSTIKLNFPTAGLYRFKLGATPGRYKLMVNDKQLHKIVADNAAADFTAWMPAGVLPLQIAQDSSVSSTAWSVEVSATTETSDKLPFARGGGTLVGTSATFKEEWVPLQIPNNRPVNVKVTVNGATSDSVKIEMYGDPTKAATYTAATVFGGETFWGNAALQAGNNLLHLVAASTNKGPISYEVSVQDVATIPSTWSGIAQGNGLRSIVQMNAPVDGVYNIVLNIAEGSGQIVIDAQPQAPTPNLRIQGSSTTLRVPLTRGPHTFAFQQDADAAKTVWEMSANLRRSDKLFIYMPMAQR